MTEDAEAETPLIDPQQYFLAFSIYERRKIIQLLAKAVKTPDKGLTSVSMMIRLGMFSSSLFRQLNFLKRAGMVRSIRADGTVKYTLSEMFEVDPFSTEWKFKFGGYLLVGQPWIRENNPKDKVA